MTPPFSVHRARKAREEGLPPHAHDAGQLTFAASGMAQVHTGDGVWLVPPQLAVWVPPGVTHRVEILTDAELWMVHWPFDPLMASGIVEALRRAFALRITPLLRSLLDAAVDLEPASAKAAPISALMLQELTEMPDAPTFLPLPASAAGRRVADVMLADGRNALDLAEIASRAATSVRTASRLIRAETGLTLKAWRQRARIVRAMERLGAGGDPGSVAREGGFSSTAAFSSAFRQVTGTTPTAFSAGGPPAASGRGSTGFRRTAPAPAD